jgi:spore maturation protein CgeB
MRVLVIHPGASTSTADVHNGYVTALERAGHEVKLYHLDARIDRAGQWLKFNYRKSRQQQPDVPKPSAADVLYWAGVWSVEMALRLQPDWVLVMSGMYLLKDTMILLRRATRSFGRMALLCTESPYDDDAQQLVAPLFDVVFTNERVSVPRLRQVNPATFYLPHAYDPERHAPAEPPAETPRHDVVFVGSLFQERIELLQAVDWSGIDLGLYGSFTLLGSRNPLRQYVRSKVPITNERAVDLYRAAKIGLNLHRTSMGFGRDAPRIALAESLNPRAYELAACGVFQISDARREVGMVLGDGVPTFTTPAELGRLVRHYIEHETDRQALAERARLQVQGQTFDRRMETLAEVLRHGRTAAA